MAEENIQIIRKFVNDVESLSWVASVQSILDAPLLTINSQSLTDLVNEISTLETQNVDLIEAEYELLNSPIFKDLLISKNAKTTGVLINFKRNESCNRSIGSVSTLQELGHEPIVLYRWNGFMRTYFGFLSLMKSSQKKNKRKRDHRMSSSSKLTKSLSISLLFIM